MHIKAISQEMPQPSFTIICLKIRWLKFHSNFPGANELMELSVVKMPFQEPDHILMKTEYHRITRTWDMTAAQLNQDGAMLLNRFPLYWPSVRGIYRLPIDSRHKRPVMWWFVFFFYGSLKKNCWTSSRSAAIASRDAISKLLWDKTLTEYDLNTIM